MLPSAEKQPIPDYLTNGIMVYFLYDHRFIFIQKKYSPDKQNWFFRFNRKKQQEKEKEQQDFTTNNYYVHSHKQVIKIDNSNIKRKDNDKTNKYDSLIPDTDIWVGLLRHPITEGNIRLYYSGKYTSLKSTYGGFISKYFTGLKSSFVTRTKNITNKEDVLVEKWYIYPDIPANQAVFIL